jgi:hypothetical protein
MNIFFIEFSAGFKVRTRTTSSNIYNLFLLLSDAISVVQLLFFINDFSFFVFMQYFFMSFYMDFWENTTSINEIYGIFYGSLLCGVPFSFYRLFS